MPIRRLHPHLALFACIACTFLAIYSACPAAAANDQTVQLTSSRRPGDADRVTVELKMVGEGIEPGEKGTRRIDTRVAVELQYDEWTVAVPGVKSDALRSLRHYHRAAGVLKVAKDGLSPELRPDRRTIIAELNPGQGTAGDTDQDSDVTLYSPEGPLTREELELLEVFGNSLLLDGLLPRGAVKQGTSWAIPERLLARLLDLDSVGHSDVKAELTEVTPQLARFKLVGTVDGSIHGAATEVALKAKYRLDRRRGRVDWFAMVAKEQRKISPVGMMGLDVTAQVIVRVEPAGDTPELTDEQLGEMNIAADAGLTQLEYTPEDGQWRLDHGRDWYVTRDEHDLVVLRLVKDGAFLSQCNLAVLSRVDPAELATLEEFKADVEKRLADQSAKIESAGQWENDAEYRVFRVVAHGKASATEGQDETGLPVQWRYYLVADRHGRRAVLAFTLEPKHAEAFAQSDQALVGGLRLDEPVSESRNKPGGEPNRESKDE